MRADREDPSAGERHQPGLGPAGLVDLLAAGHVDPGRGEVHGQERRVGDRVRVRLLPALDAQDDVAAGVLGGVQPEVVAPGVPRDS